MAHLEGEPGALEPGSRASLVPAREPVRAADQRCAKPSTALAPQPGGGLLRISARFQPPVLGPSACWGPLEGQPSPCCPWLLDAEWQQNTLRTAIAGTYPDWACWLPPVNSPQSVLRPFPTHFSPPLQSTCSLADPTLSLSTRLDVLPRHFFPWDQWLLVFLSLTFAYYRPCNSPRWPRNNLNNSLAVRHEPLLR